MRELAPLVPYKTLRPESRDSPVLSVRWARNMSPVVRSAELILEPQPRFEGFLAELRIVAPMALAFCEWQPGICLDAFARTKRRTDSSLHIGRRDLLPLPDDAERHLARQR